MLSEVKLPEIIEEKPVNTANKSSNRSEICEDKPVKSKRKYKKKTTKAKKNV